MRVEAAQPQISRHTSPNRRSCTQAAAVHATRSLHVDLDVVSAFLSIARCGDVLTILPAHLSENPTRPGVLSCDQDQLIGVVGSTSRGVDAAAS